jgi:hypothetical protein
MKKISLLVSLLIVSFSSLICQNAPLWGRFEIPLNLATHYNNPFTDVSLYVKYIRPDGSIIDNYGFYDENNSWKIRVMPDQIGKWEYSAWFSDNSENKMTGSFLCVESDIPGLVSCDETNPVWFGFKGGQHRLIRSFHVGDCFFAENWPDNERKQFLDWLSVNRYNTISVASHLLNRNADNRGKGWITPDLWNKERQQPNPGEYKKMEQILDELAARKIVVFPFAGFFGQNSNYPVDSVNQALYIKYTISRLGAYWNILFSVAGPEPLNKNINQFTIDQINSLGNMISSFNSQDHLLSVHNAKNKNPFVDAPWATYQCLQGPTTLNLDTLYEGLLARRNYNQPVFAQEVLWYGNIYHPIYSNEQLRKNAFTILMAGAALNFADNAGTSSSGFSGTLHLPDRHQMQHDIIKKVWNFFASFPFYQYTPSKGISDNGFTLAKDGEMYLTYLPYGGEVNLNLQPGIYNGVWIKGANTRLRNFIGTTDGKHLKTPSSEDWFLYLQNIGSVSKLQDK